MRHFLKIASGVEVLPLALDLYRQPELWDQNAARTGGAGSFEGTSDIWVRFRAYELVSRDVQRAVYADLLSRVARVAASASDRVRAHVALRGGATWGRFDHACPAGPSGGAA